MSAASSPDIVEIASPFGFQPTLDRVVGAIEAAGLTVFARIDHAAGAMLAGLQMPPTVVLIYGNAKGGTPIMLAAPRAALDLPLRVLVREEGQQTILSFHNMPPLLAAAGVPEDLLNRLNPAQDLLIRAIRNDN